MSDKNNSSDYMEFEYKYKKNNDDEPVKVILDLSRFSNSEYTKQTNKDQAKYNVKLSKRDVYLIDEIASIENTSRAEIINRLVFYCMVFVVCNRSVVRNEPLPITVLYPHTPLQDAT